MVRKKKKLLPHTQRLLEVVSQLRKKCPWDRKQTHKTLVRYLVEEAYETVQAIERGSPEQFREELGDLLLQIVLHSEIASEKKKFDFEAVAKGITEKMIRRHPQIYGSAKIKNVKAHLKNWTKVKSSENPKKFLLEGIPTAMPALQLAQRYGEIAASVGFDWPSIKGVLDKVDEEMNELKVEIERKSRKPKDMEMELGDMLFTLSRLAGHLDIDAERALRRSAAKFADRFTHLEKSTRASGKHLSDFSLQELEAVWQQHKNA